jgi:lysophospholipase L1-like esterase
VKRGALLLTVIALSLAVGEVVLRRLDLPRFDACRATAAYAIPDPVLGFRGKPGGEVTDVVLNELGLRGPVPAMPKPEGLRRILFLGDSTCWGLGVSLEESFGARATALLREAQPGRPLDFVLGAFPGYSSYHSAILLDRLLPLEPDLVVFYVGARNDGTRARYFRDAAIPERQARLRSAWHQVRILRGIEAGVDGSYRSLLRKLQPRTEQSRVPPPAFLANLRGMASRLDAAGIPSLVLLPPISPDFESTEPHVRLYRAALTRVAEEFELPMASFDERFATDSRALFFEDQFHLNAHGHEIVAETTRDAILREGWLEAATP